MAKAEASVEELVGMIERGELRLPEMQRRYVWRSTRVRDLLDSLYRGYPSGAILLWETDEKVPLQEMAIAQQNNPYQSTRLLLDGQQRLTSLSAVIRGEPVSVRGRKTPIDLLFNLDHPEHLAIVTEVEEEGHDEDDDDDLIEDEADSNEDELQKRFDQMTFVVTTRKLEQLPQWVRVTEVFKTDEDAPFLERAGIEKVSDPRYKKYSQRLARLRGIRKYSYRMDVLERSRSYNEVTEIFVRVNSLGAKLRSSDLALAQITTKWRKSLQVFLEFQKKCAKKGCDLDLGIYLKNLIVFTTGQSRFLTVGGLQVEELKPAWEESCRGMEFALNFLKNNVGIDSPMLLSSPFLLITLGYYGHKRDYALSPQESDQLRYWALVANAKGRYSRGSTETLLDQDLTILKTGGGAQELIDRLRQQVGRLDIAPEELEGRNQRSALFKTMFLAFRATNAKDWRSQVAIALDHSGSQHKLQFHHIFPKAVLKASYTGREADDIANLCFIAGKTNRQISDKAPSQYFAPIIEKSGVEAFDSQCIPTNANLLNVDAYKAFLQRRRELVSKRLNAFLNQSNEIAGQQVSIEMMIADGENDKREFKSTLRWDLKEGVVNKKLEEIILKTVAAFSNSRGGTLLVGVSDDGQVLGLEHDYISLGSVNRDKFELHVRNLLNQQFGTGFITSKVQIIFHRIDEKDVCKIVVLPAREPVIVTLKNKNGQVVEKFYARSGNSSQEIPLSEMSAYMRERFQT
ncbi:MAG: DUF262 domain-containing protein [Deltaproteobacteria bacterium]|nr:DUF262 domain-containing protein [Deltaproteobacteria bacterium]